MNVGLKIDKSLFFDRTKVLDALGKATAKAMARGGGLVRTIARRSIRKRRQSSLPGQPPSSHVGLLRERIYFAYDPATDSMVIGPEATNQVFFDDQFRPVTGVVPEVLEHGGAITVVEEWTGKKWRRADLRRTGSVSDVGALRHGKPGVYHRGRPIRRRRVEIAARPYMQPALEKARPKLVDPWADSIAA